VLVEGPTPQRHTLSLRYVARPFALLPIARFDCLEFVNIPIRLPVAMMDKTVVKEDSNIVGLAGKTGVVESVYVWLVSGCRSWFSDMAEEWQ
jgi:hypothetical protein